MALSHGANSEQLTSLGTKMKGQEEPIRAVISAVGSALGNTEWVGPARQQFEGEWNSTFQPTLTRLIEAFNSAGTDCINRSTALQQVMGAR
jgi:hypothetical protein